MFDRLPPQNLEAEMATIGSILIGGQPILDRALEIIQPEDFFQEKHRLILEAILRLSAKKENVDIVTLSEELGNYLDKIGGYPYLTALANNAPSLVNIEHYANIVRDKSLARQKIMQNIEINEKLYDGEDSIDIITKSMLSDMETINKRKKSQIIKIGPEVEKAYHALDNYKDGDGIFGISTGFKDLDHICGGLQSPSYNILAARPSIGKSTFAMNIAKHVAQVLKIPVLIFSLEMSKEQLARKFLSLFGSVDSKLFHNAWRITDNQWNNLANAVNNARELELYIDDTCNLKASEIWIRARKFKTAYPNLGLIITDYLQKMAGEHPKMPPIERVSEASSICFNMAKELKLPVITVSQLSRGVEQRDNKIPVLSDLRESGTIEQDADTVTFLYRPDYYNDDKSAPDPSETAVILAKNRLEGGIGAVKLKYYKALQRYESY
jgi:replicative DNA helicase